MANRRFVLTIPAPEGSGMRVKDLTGALEQTARNIRSGFSVLSQGSVREPGTNNAIGKYEFVEDDEQSPATLVAQRWLKLRQAVRLRQVLTEKGGTLEALAVVNEIIDMMDLIEEGKLS